MKQTLTVLPAVKILLFSVSGLWLAGCATAPSVSDSGPPRPVDVSHIPDAVPRHEVRTNAGNKSPYTVLGKTYQVMPSPDGFRQTGIASWYGRKFHGLRTSNGEIYDMYGMTAAHKTLPIPSYVRVTNTDNNRSVVVRVNDRGPFHEGRIIDLSYTAATKLGFTDKGTAPVTIEVVTPDTPVVKTSAAATSAAAVIPVDTTTRLEKAPAPLNSEGYRLPANTFLQAGAFSSSDAAQSVSVRIAQLVAYPVSVVQRLERDALYRVRIGPIDDNWELMKVRELLQKNQLPEPHVVYD